MQDGENSIGRQAGNSVVLPSAKFPSAIARWSSKNGEVVKDQGSSNGTFVNGALTKSKLATGDRISVGEYVIELTQPSVKPARPANALSGMGNVIQFPGTGGGHAFIPRILDARGYRVRLRGAPGRGSSATAPKDLKGKLLWLFEQHVMPIFYNLVLKHEWR